MILIHQKHDKITMLWGKKWSCSRSLTYYIKCQTKSLRHKGTKNPGSAAKNSSVVIFRSHGGLLCFEKEQMPDASSIQNLYPRQRCCKSLWNVQGMKRLQKKRCWTWGLQQTRSFMTGFTDQAHCSRSSFILITYGLKYHTQRWLDPWTEMCRMVDACTWQLWLIGE